MQLTAKVKLHPTSIQRELLRQTLEQANAACNAISQAAWDNRSFGKFALQKLVYYDMRQQFALSAQLVIRCIAKVADAYKQDKQTRRRFKPHGSIPFDNRILSWNLDHNEISIWTVNGRAIIPFVASPTAKEHLAGSRGESDLLLIKGEFYLYTACTVEELAPSVVSDVLGVDLGIANIAVDNDKTIYQGKSVKQVRFRHRHLRQRLQKKGTKASRRKLRQLAGKEARFAKDVNHVISKRIV